MTASAPMTASEPSPAREFPRLYVPPTDGGYVDTDVESLIESAQAVTLPFGFRAPPPSGVTTATAGAFGPQYLVLLHGTDSDLPLGLFEDRDEAVEFAREVRDNPDAHAERLLAVCSATMSARRRWLTVSVLEFAGPVPTGHTTIFEIDP
jgi:hypothetical protein